jgi:hypothetical protein
MIKNALAVLVEVVEAIVQVDGTAKIKVDWSPSSTVPLFF